MTPINYCYDKIASNGSAVYYSLKKIPAAKRDAIVAISCFYQEIMDVILKSTDLNVTYTQLNWWRGEVAKISPGMAEHPVTLFLQQIWQKNPTLFDIQPLYDMLDGLEQSLVLSPFESFEDVVIHFMRTAGVRELLMIDVLAFPEKIPAEMIYQFTIVLELVNYIQHLRQYARCGFVYFPLDEMNKFNVTVEALKEFKTSKEIINLLEYQFEKAGRAYTKACEELTPPLRKSLAYLIARCDIAQATLREIQVSGFSVLENFIQLTPLRMWWIAYRA